MKKNSYDLHHQMLILASVLIILIHAAFSTAQESPSTQPAAPGPAPIDTAIVPPSAQAPEPNDYESIAEQFQNGNYENFPEGIDDQRQVLARTEVLFDKPEKIKIAKDYLSKIDYFSTDDDTGKQNRQILSKYLRSMEKRDTGGPTFSKLPEDGSGLEDIGFEIDEISDKTYLTTRYGVSLPIEQESLNGVDIDINNERLAINGNLKGNVKFTRKNDDAAENTFVLRNTDSESAGVRAVFYKKEVQPNAIGPTVEQNSANGFSVDIMGKGAELARMKTGQTDKPEYTITVGSSKDDEPGFSGVYFDSNNKPTRVDKVNNENFENPVPAGATRTTVTGLNRGDEKFWIGFPKKDNDIVGAEFEEAPGRISFWHEEYGVLTGRDVEAYPALTSAVERFSRDKAVAYAHSGKNVAFTTIAGEDRNTRRLNYHVDNLDYLAYGSVVPENDNPDLPEGASAASLSASSTSAFQFVDGHGFETTSSALVGGKNSINRVSSNSKVVYVDYNDEDTHSSEYTEFVEKLAQGMHTDTDLTRFHFMHDNELTSIATFAGNPTARFGENEMTLFGGNTFGYAVTTNVEGTVSKARFNGFNPKPEEDGAISEPNYGVFSSSTRSEGIVTSLLLRKNSDIEETATTADLSPALTYETQYRQGDDLIQSEVNVIEEGNKAKISLAESQKTEPGINIDEFSELSYLRFRLYTEDLNDLSARGGTKENSDALNSRDVYIFRSEENIWTFTMNNKRDNDGALKEESEIERLIVTRANLDVPVINQGDIEEIEEEIEQAMKDSTFADDEKARIAKKIDAATIEVTTNNDVTANVKPNAISNTVFDPDKRYILIRKDREIHFIEEGEPIPNGFVHDTSYAVSTGKELNELSSMEGISVVPSEIGVYQPQSQTGFSEAEQLKYELEVLLQLFDDV